MPTVSVIPSQEDSQDTEIKEVQVQEGELLFDQLEGQGITLPHGCLAGSCGSCRVEVVEGAENLKPAGAIEKDTIATITNTYIEDKGAAFMEGKTIRLSCRARVNGDVKICPLKK